jgi:pilus assembly protein FimV
MISRSLSIAVLACAGLSAASPVQALGFGRIPESIPFGQALDLTLPLRLDAGESLTLACVQAEVHVGEQRLPPGMLRMSLEPRDARGDEWRLRLRSATLVQEPLVAVSVAVGCHGSVSRRFVVFADPWSAQAEVVRAALVEAVPTAPVAAAAEVVPRARASAHASAVAVRNPAAKNVTPRLQLEEPEERLKVALRAVAARDAALASAVQMTGAAEAATSAATQRIVAMEADMRSMRDDATVHRASMDLMRQRLVQSEGQGRIRPLLAAAVVALLLLALWLGWRVRALQRERHAAWWQGAAAETEAAPPVEAELMAEPAAVTPAVVLDPPDTPPSSAWAEVSLTRPISVDELIDLEQQADFFMVLGEEDAAVDLLISHLPGAAGASPLPCLKLLEIYRRRGDRDTYEGVRRRFNQRFDAVAPDWQADPEQGRELQHHPAVLAAVQAAWPRPLEAMGELEKLLFPTRGGELFELSLYRDLLTLYSVARDLHRQIGQPTNDVDVLLPLGVGEAAASSIFDKLDSRYPEGAAGGRPAAPVDLDLSEPPTASSAAPAR